MMKFSSVYGSHEAVCTPTFRHDPNEVEDDVLRELFSDPNQGISDLLDSLWCYLAASDAPIHNIQEVLNWQVWGTRGTVNGINAFII